MRSASGVKNSLRLICNINVSITVFNEPITSKIDGIIRLTFQSVSKELDNL